LKKSKNYQTCQNYQTVKQIDELQKLTKKALIQLLLDKKITNFQPSQTKAQLIDLLHEYNNETVNTTNSQPSASSQLLQPESQNPIQSTSSTQTTESQIVQPTPLISSAQPCQFQLPPPPSYFQSSRIMYPTQLISSPSLHNIRNSFHDHWENILSHTLTVSLVYQRRYSM